MKFILYQSDHPELVDLNCSMIEVFKLFVIYVSAMVIDLKVIKWLYISDVTYLTYNCIK